MALQRVTIGLSASAQVLAVRVEDDDLDNLLQALKGGEWHDLTVDDGTIRLNLGQVLYVRTSRDEHRVGFGAAG
ncbi:MAG: hypothetical protein M3N04_00035 [Actinomycetota bacterium]|nr:hypothetical protein [Actinomycetota bacterium]MDP8966967.1 hypothetical protein [Actinomycetota bacterium]